MLAPYSSRALGAHKQRRCAVSHTYSKKEPYFDYYHYYYYYLYEPRACCSRCSRAGARRRERERERDLEGDPRRTASLSAAAKGRPSEKAPLRLFTAAVRR